ncbi:Hypothetical predicted protein, partial [Mytilus galloprovincialis]
MDHFSRAVIKKWNYLTVEQRQVYIDLMKEDEDNYEKGKQLKNRYKEEIVNTIGKIQTTLDKLDKATQNIGYSTVKILWPREPVRSAVK